MPTAWYLVPYARKESPGLPCRYCEIDDLTTEIIYTYGGAWAETEMLGNRAVVKVRTRQAILNVLDNRFTRLPRNRLDDPLFTLPSRVIDHMRDWLLDAGYSNDEIHEKFGGHLGDFTLRDFLHFCVRRRLKPRYNAGDDTIYVDGEEQPCRSVESVDDEVTE